MLDINWGEPYSVREGLSTVWKREWCIPQEMLSGFFSFWKKNRFKLLAEGFAVVKSEKLGKWYLVETKSNVALFKTFKEAPPKPEDSFVLPPYEVKYTDKLRPWQINAVSKLCASIKHWGAAVDGSDTGCHAKGQLILMADGSVKKVEDIIIGDLVMGWKGPQRVTELKRGRQQMAKIIPIKGDPFVVNLDHILTVVLTNGCSPSHKKTGGYKYGTIVDIKVKDYLHLPNATKHAMKLFSVGTEWNEKPQLVSPYLMGILLGDGGMSSRSAITITSQNEEIWKFVKFECAKNGWNLGNTNKAITKRIINAPNLFFWLRYYKLFPISCENKFIPYEYKTGNTNQRLEILAGLLDTDGHLGVGNIYEITLKSKQLSEDIVFICRSLGLSANMKPCRKKCSNGVVGNYYRTIITGNIDLIPVKINYKKAASRKQKKNNLRRGFKIELLNEDDYYGFSLDGDGRFLLGDFTVTHNTGKTYSACAVARELDLNICVVCPKAVIKSWEKVIKNHFKMEDRLIGITNYEKLRTGKKDSSIASFVLKKHTKRPTFQWKLPKKTLIIWDEAHKLKNWQTQNAKRCVDAIKAGYPMIFCSATIATNPLEMRTIGLGLKLFKNGNSYYDWAYENGVYKGQWGLEFNNDPKILKRLHHSFFGQRGIRLRRDDVPGFPECEVIPQVYNIDEKDAQTINEIFFDMERELELLHRREKADRVNADKANRELQEIVIQLRARQKIELIKVPLIVDMINDAKEEGFSVAIFVNFTETLNAIADRINTKCIFDGNVPDKIRDNNVELFQNDEERVILVNIQSGGAGLNLQDFNGKFPRMSIISPSHSAIVMRQALGRVWRDGAKTKSVQRIVCVANTVEEGVCRNVQQKLNNLDLLNDGDLKFSKNYIVD